MKSKKGRIGILLSGRGSNFEAILKKIKQGYINAKIVLVVSDNKEARGLNIAKKSNIKTISLNKKDYKNRHDFDKQIITYLKGEKIDLVVLAGYMRIISKNFVESFKNKIMNIHPALLPAFPGLNAQKKALRYGVKYSGCTVHFVDEKVDHGPIILQSVVPVYQDDTEDSLSKRILKKEHVIFPEAIKLFFEDKLKVEGRRVILG